MRQLWIADALRDAGCPVAITANWRTRGHDEFAPTGVLIHHTAGPAGGDAPSLNVCIDGRPGIPGPLCHVLIGRDGLCHIIAAGRANHAGKGGPLPGIRRDQGNSLLFGVEAENDGVGEPWSPAQLDTLTRVTAALLHGLNLTSAAWCWGHKEYAPGRKIDPAGIDMNQFRREVQIHLDHKAGTMPKPDRTVIVRQMQQRLNDSGAQPPLTLDGDPGPATDAALNAVLTWQQNEMGRLLIALGGQVTENERLTTELDATRVIVQDLRRQLAATPKLGDVVTALEQLIAKAKAGQP
jgi:N-acetylmuramoyl-L-alanine amidase